MKSETDRGWVTLRQIDMDLHRKQLKIQVDEMYRKFRWQVAPDGPYADPLLYQMCSDSKRMLSEVKDLYLKWHEPVIKICEEFRKQGVPLTVEEMLDPEGYRDTVLDNLSAEDLAMMWKVESEILQRAYLITMYHTKVLENVDKTQPISSRREA